MKITLTQAEIELAVRNHINNTIPVPEDADLELQFEDGEYSAVIDLHPTEEDKVVKAEAKATAVTKRTYNKKPKADPAPTATLVTPANAAELLTPATQTVDSPAQADAGDAKDTPAGDEPSGDANASPEPVVDNVPTETPRSLFGGLTRPKND